MLIFNEALNMSKNIPIMVAIRTGYAANFSIPESLTSKPQNVFISNFLCNNSGAVNLYPHWGHVLFFFCLLIEIVDARSENPHTGQIVIEIL